MAKSPHKLGKRSYPYVKKSFKTQHGRIAIDPAILAAIGHRFIANKKKRKLKMRTRRLRPATRADTTETGDFFVCLISVLTTQTNGVLTAFESFSEKGELQLSSK